MTATFFIRLNDTDQKTTEDFLRFLEKLGIDPEEASAITSEFETNVVSRVSGFRQLAANGSNVEFSRSFETTQGRMVVQLDATPKSLLRQLSRLFGR